MSVMPTVWCDAHPVESVVKQELGCVSYPVRAFVPKPLLCFRFQAYGHVAALCRREIFPKCEQEGMRQKSV